MKGAQYSISWLVVKVAACTAHTVEALNRPASLPEASPFLQSSCRLAPPPTDVRNILNLLYEPLYTLFPLPRGTLLSLYNEQTLQS